MCRLFVLLLSLSEAQSGELWLEKQPTLVSIGGLEVCEAAVSHSLATQQDVRTPGVHAVWSSRVVSLLH